MFNPVELTLYSQLLEATCAEMGRVLQQSAYSPNIKERRDLSCAIFDADGRMLAQGRDIPVHLGSMPASVEAALSAQRLGPGDVVLINDPYHGGTHLPDLTVVAPFFWPGGSAPTAFLANRAHHADVGGTAAGSMPLSTELLQEGLVIPPVKVVRRGRVHTDVVDMLCANSRTPRERRGDLLAQLASLRRGLQRMEEFDRELRATKLALSDVFSALYLSGQRAACELILSLPDGKTTGSARLELPEGEAWVRVELAKQANKLQLDFSATDVQRAGPFNAVRPITQSAVLYVLRCLLPEDVPTGSALLDAVSITTKPGTLVDALPPAAVAAGNVETSQRIVEALFDALRKLLPERISAASQGTMNNVLIGAADASGTPFTYYETMGGGHGAAPRGPGLSARHCHMTNSLNTPVEALEHAYPLRVLRYAVRRESGGGGGQRGGDGIVREVEFLRDCELTLLRQSCATGPAGTQGGQAGASGIATLRRGGRKTILPSSYNVRVSAGDVLTVETPGGGGYGRARRSDRERT